MLMVSKPEKPVDETTSHRPMSLLPTPSKMFEKPMMCRIKNDIELPISSQITSLVLDICTSVFLVIAQAFDKI